MPLASSTSVNAPSGRPARITSSFTAPPKPAIPSLFQTAPPASEATNVPCPFASATRPRRVGVSVAAEETQGAAAQATTQAAPTANENRIELLPETRVRADGGHGPIGPSFEVIRL